MKKQVPVKLMSTPSALQIALTSFELCIYFLTISGILSVSREEKLADFLEMQRRRRQKGVCFSSPILALNILLSHILLFNLCTINLSLFSLFPSIFKWVFFCHSSLDCVDLLHQVISKLVPSTPLGKCLHFYEESKFSYFQEFGITLLVWASVNMNQQETQRQKKTKTVKLTNIWRDASVSWKIKGTNCRWDVFETILDKIKKHTEVQIILAHIKHISCKNWLHLFGFTCLFETIHSKHSSAYCKIYRSNIDLTFYIGSRVNKAVTLLYIFVYGMPIDHKTQESEALNVFHWPFRSFWRRKFESKERLLQTNWATSVF